MKNINPFLKTLVISILIGGPAGFYLGQSFFPQRLKYVDSKTVKATTLEIASSAIDTTEISSQKFTNVLIPDLKKNIIQENPATSTALDNEQFWIKFKEDNAKELNELDDKFNQLIANSLLQLSKNELLEYLNLQNSKEVKNIQEKIKSYMIAEFQQDYQANLNVLEQVILEHLNKEKQNLEPARPDKSL